MSILDNLSKKVLDVGTKAAQKTKDFSDVTRLNSLISQEEEKIKVNCLEIGKTYVSLYKNNYGPEFEQYINLISSSNEKIEDYKKQIENIKKLNCCEKCGAEIEQNMEFCSNCGNKVTVNQETVEEKGTIKCLQCGKYIKEGMKFCTSCGLKMDEVNSEIEMPKVKNNCQNCGESIEENGSFCIKCGTKI